MNVVFFSEYAMSCFFIIFLPRQAQDKRSSFYERVNSRKTRRQPRLTKRKRSRKKKGEDATGNETHWTFFLVLLIAS